MPKKNRLTRADFQSLRTTRRIQGRFFILSYSPLETGGFKAACVVSKKVALRANARNLIKRRFRAIIRSQDSSKLIQKSCVFTAKKSIKEATYQEITADVVELLHALNR